MIDKRVLEQILSDQQEEIAARSGEKLCHRLEESRISLESSQTQIVAGVRGSGKSTLCCQALRDGGVKFACANFDDERLFNLSAEQLNDVLEALYMIYGAFTHLFLDEIQNIEGWQLFVNRLLRQRMRVILAGSNTKLLSGELATRLSGRNHEVRLYPFSFKEFCAMKGVDCTSLSTKAEAFRRAAFDGYLKSGGFPELLLNQNSRAYVSGLLDNILRHDIEGRYSISYKAAFEDLAAHLLNKAPVIVAPGDLARRFGFKSAHTARNYLNFLEHAFLLSGICKYSPKSRIRMAPEKVYAIDVALMGRRKNAFDGANRGHRLETVVLLELQRRGALSGLEVKYLKERSGECDFLVCYGNRVIQAVQVSYDLAAAKTRKREIKGLLLAAKLTGCTDLLLLTDHERDDVVQAGRSIRVRPVYQWCLEDAKAPV